MAERAIAISHETVRIWWNWVGRMLATEIRKRSVAHMHSYPRAPSRLLTKSVVTGIAL